MNTSTIREKTLSPASLPDRGKSFAVRRLLPQRLAISPLLPVALLPMVILLAIVAVFLWISVQTGIVGTADAKYSLENYTALFGDPFILQVLENTLVFAVAVTAVSLVVGLPVAWITERTTIRPKELIYAMMTMGLLVPPVFIGMGWTFIAHPRIGIANKMLMALFGLQSGPISIQSSGSSTRNVPPLSILT